MVELDLNIAHKLRIELWKEHLRLLPEWLVDGVASEVHWRYPSPTSRITPYLVEGKARHTYDFDPNPIIDGIVDPRP